MQMDKTTMKKVLVTKINIQKPNVLNRASKVFPVIQYKYNS